MLWEMDLPPFSPSPPATSDIPIGLTTRALVHLRAHALASADGYAAPHVSQDNYEQAKRELSDITEARRVEMLRAVHAAENMELQLS